MSSQSTSHSWTYTALGLLAGLGAGALIAVITTRLTRPRPPPQRQPPRDQELLRTLNALSAEVARLREVVTESRAVWNGRSMRTVDSSSEFVSARSESVESDDEFFDITTTPNS